VNFVFTSVPIFIDNRILLPDRFNNLARMFLCPQLGIMNEFRGVARKQVLKDVWFFGVDIGVVFGVDSVRRSATDV